MRLLNLLAIASITLGGFMVQNAFADSSRIFFRKLENAAIQRSKTWVLYDPRYYKIAYPNGDIPIGRGVCSDVIIRSYRALGIDLQQQLHEDMKSNFAQYPKIWGLKRTDSNIDHRRVPNLEVFFTRKGSALPITQKPEDYQPGDLVSYRLRPNGSLPHIAIVVAKKGRSGVPMIVHNIGFGPRMTDELFDWKITGHFRYNPN